jgi:NAD(P)-dependent dehydrogenase (short-subunit alcohol dehydrogenase family)
MSQSQRVTVVTGGSAGIGLTITQQLLEAGHYVISLARRHAPFEHERLESIEVDLSDTVATRDVAATIAARHSVDGFVHNAGVIRPNLVDDVEVDDLQYLTRLHLECAIVLTQAFLPRMREAGFGRIVIIGSRAMVGMQTRTSYSATKAGQVALVRTWALELAPEGITVNCVAPGPVETDMFHELVPEESEQKAALAKSIPVGRIGTPDDVARSTLFFLDEQSGFVTGQTLFVCGGTSIGSLSL